MWPTWLEDTCTFLIGWLFTWCQKKIEHLLWLVINYNGLLHEFHPLVVGWKWYLACACGWLCNCFDFGSFDSRLKTALIQAEVYHRISYTCITCAKLMVTFHYVSALKYSCSLFTFIPCLTKNRTFIKRSSMKLPMFRNKRTLLYFSMFKLNQCLS